MALFRAAKEPFLRQFLTLKHGIPSHDTFSRVLRLLDPKTFAACFTPVMERFADGLQNVVAIDGKTLRRSFDQAAEQSPLHMLHVWSMCQRRHRSPEQISGRRKRIEDGVTQLSGVTVSHEAIYTAVYALPRGELRRELIACLRQDKPHRGRKPKGSERRGKLCNMTNIKERPQEVEGRLVPGHW
jgi:hypothetical protein